MCYHVSTPSKEQLEIFAEEEDLVLEGESPRYFHASGFDMPLLSVTLNDQPKWIKDARWKLLPSSVESEEDAKHHANTLNAVCEEIFETNSYKNYIGKYRGLLWVNGFYEPHYLEGNSKTKNYFIYRPNKEIFSLGIVWAPWQDKNTGKVTNTFSIITTPANQLLSEIHNKKKRMPLIILKEDRANWMAAETREEIEAFFKPAPEDYLTAHKIAAHITGGRQNFNYPEVQDIDLSPDTIQGSLF